MSQLLVSSTGETTVGTPSSKGSKGFNDSHFISSAKYAVSLTPPI